MKWSTGQQLSKQICLIRQICRLSHSSLGISSLKCHIDIAVEVSILRTEQCQTKRILVLRRAYQSTARPLPSSNKKSKHTKMELLPLRRSEVTNLQSSMSTTDSDQIVSVYLWEEDAARSTINSLHAINYLKSFEKLSFLHFYL